MKKKLLAMFLTSAMILGTISACGSTESSKAGDTSKAETTAGDTSKADDTSKGDESQVPAGEGYKTPEGKYELAADEGKVLNIAAWNKDAQAIFQKYFDARLPEGVKFNWIITANEGNAYQNKLDEQLKAQATAAADEKIDIFLVEADYALKYVNAETPVAMSTADLGITDDDIAQMYAYTKDIAKDSSGAIRALSWQATPGLFAYRRDIAKKVLGTDDPVEVQKLISDWTKFDEVAKKMADADYKMLSGYDDSYRVFSNNVSAPWVNDKNEIIIDANIKAWADQTKLYTDKGYNNKTSLWAPEWSKDQSSAGKVFGFFYSTWGINFTLKGNSLDKSVDDGGKEEVGNGLFGQYAVCAGPQSFFWGGTWICAAVGTDNKGLVADAMKTMTCDGDFARSFTEASQDYTNNQAAMEALAATDFKSAFLGGQNHIALFADSAKTIDMSMTTGYDQGLNESFQGAMKDYFTGKVDYDTAVANFYTTAITKYPNLKKPA